MKTSNLSVEMELITPKKAENYLKFNPKNRSISKQNLTFLVKEMNKDAFLENGESIVFDCDGNLKDGQHRLRAIVLSGKSYNIPVVRGVNPVSLSTYDTGKNRGAGDVLEIEGFKHGKPIAAIIKSIYKYGINKHTSATAKVHKTVMTNKMVLEYCQNNYDWLLPLYLNCQKIYAAQTVKCLSLTQMAVIIYKIAGKKAKIEHFDFIKNVVGLIRKGDSAASYLNSKLHNAKLNKEPLNFYWILGMSLKAWNYYADGDPAVKYFRFNVDNDLPKAI